MPHANTVPKSFHAGGGSNARRAHARPPQRKPMSIDISEPLPTMTGGIGASGDAWYDVLRAELSKSAARPLPKTRAFAMQLLQAEVDAHAARESHDDKLSRHIMKSGTLSDRVAALALKAGQSPVHTLTVVDQLLALCEKKQRRAASMGVEACRDLFQTALLPDDRRLAYFADGVKN